MLRFLIFVSVATTCRVEIVLAQFSPGDLARAHEKLEGMNHCADCHEVGKEISGMKCLTCHTVIKKELDMRRGYHFAVSTNNCVTCHKDHLGKDAQITVFDRKRFDHTKTGFVLTGKHATKKCEDCHTAKFIKDPEVAKKGGKTSLGLYAACISCHEDHHHGVLGAECNSCHTTNAWKPASNFDHSRTKFALIGKHRDVACDKCHNQPTPGNKSRTSILGTRTFADCTPCHATPHSARFSSQTCSSCHIPTSWREVRERQFNHDLTNFKLRGKHLDVKCQQCHKRDSKVQSGMVVRMAHDRCTDCHTDHHEGDFRVKYQNDCAKCHTEDGFQPSTFSLVRHDDSRFPLNGAHPAVPCARCHNPSSSDRSEFRFASLKCEACHKDQHNGQFRTIMGAVGCLKCHSTIDWKAVTFDHSTTSFALVGKHGSVSCSDCHQPGGKSKVVIYNGVSSKCEACHKDQHAGQFAVRGSTDCTSCHTPSGWKTLMFDHEKQSTFSLTGGHVKVPCSSCHHPESMNGKVVVRYKPVPKKCESCHGQKEMRNG